MNNIDKKYKYVLGTFRMREVPPYHSVIMDLNDEDRILIDTGVSYNVDHLIRTTPGTKWDVCSKFGVDHLANFDWYLSNHLRFLGKDKLAYGLIHFYEEGWKELASKLYEAKEKGLIEHVGVSNFNINQLKEYYEEFNKWPEVNEIEFSVRYHDLELVKFCTEHNIDVLGYGVLGGIHASKMYIREYLLDFLLGYALAHGVTPIIRSDSADHFEEDCNIIDLFREGKYRVHEEFIQTDFSYELSENTTDDRALNKFRYDKPKHALYVDLPGNKGIYTLDSHIVSEFEGKETTKISMIGELLENYNRIPRDFMMITDYLVRQKFSMSEIDYIVTSDDCLYNTTTGDYYSYLMMDNKGDLIKSGACEAIVFEKHFNLK